MLSYSIKDLPAVCTTGSMLFLDFLHACRQTGLRRKDYCDTHTFSLISKFSKSLNQQLNKWA